MSGINDKNNKDVDNKSLPKKKKRVVNSKPTNYKDTEQLAKKMLNANGINYYKWLDEKHKEAIFEKMLKNQDAIVDAIDK